MTVNLVAAGRQTTEVATVIVMAGVIFDSQPTRTQKPDMAVMLERTRDELSAIQQLWPRFEHLVGLRGRRMYAMVDIRAGTYAACTPAWEGDDPARLGLDTATLPGGWYLQARITGEPPGLYERIARPCRHSERWQSPLTLPALSSSTTGATMRLNCGYQFPRSPHRGRRSSRPGTKAAVPHSRQKRMDMNGPSPHGRLLARWNCRVWTLIAKIVIDRVRWDSCRSARQATEL